MRESEGGRVGEVREKGRGIYKGVIGRVREKNEESNRERWMGKEWKK